MALGLMPFMSFDLLISSLEYLKQKIDGLELIVLGQLEPKSAPDFGIPVRYTGFLYDDLSLRTFYSAADLVVVPSRVESFCQTASEAHACGTPVVAFDIGGLKDIVDHKKTGYLAKPFDPIDLANGIIWTLDKSPGALARDRSIQLFSNAIVAQTITNAIVKASVKALNNHLLWYIFSFSYLLDVI